MINWKNINKCPPPINTWVKLKYMITGNGAPEREGWESIGCIRRNGRFTIKHTEYIDKLPTHWDFI